MSGETSQIPPAPTQMSFKSPKNTMHSPVEGAEATESRKRARSPNDADGGQRGEKRRDRRDRGGQQRGRRGPPPQKSRAGRSKVDPSEGDRRARTQRTQIDGKEQKLSYGVEFSKEEIENESRRPKRKVAVMIGYSGSGYKGMQLNNKEKTIEGDLFAAFVAAGAISKANADDPKKSALVRCARTDKGVHAVGNVISLKLIVEEEDIVSKINSHLSPQIRVWGLERTNGSFSAYQACDSRIYEYLIPTHCFVPPHPRSFLGKQLVELAQEAGDLEGYQSRQEDVLSFWDEAERNYIKPILDELDPEIARDALQAIFDANTKGGSKTDEEGKQTLGQIESSGDPDKEQERAKTSEEQITNPAGTEGPAEQVDPSISPNTTDPSPEAPKPANPPQQDSAPPPVSTLDAAIRRLKQAYLHSKLTYRITPARLSRLQSILTAYTGTHRFHNYTIAKGPSDPSAKRHIKSFVVTSPDKPLLINGTEWLSLKVHGQSFMMHQIRKMVSMAALMVRCGTPESRIADSFGATRISIPRAPGLGLLLERPVFGSYNDSMRHRGGIERSKIEFGPYQEVMDEFKQREIYERIWREEESGGLFHGLFAAVDVLRSAQLLYLSSGGIEATGRVVEGEVNRRGVKGGKEGAEVEMEVDGEGEGDEEMGEGGEEG